MTDTHDSRLTTHDSPPLSRVLKGHTDAVWGIDMTPDGRLAVSGSDDKTVRMWDMERGRCLAILKGHTEWVNGVSLTPDGRLAVSGSGDKTIRVWDLEAGRCLASLEGHTGEVWGVSVTPDARLAVSGSSDKTVRVWDLPLPDAAPAPGLSTARYTNAKVVLVGESGVGKSGLGYRLAEDRWVVTESTHGMKVWPLELPAAAQDPTIEREVWLWDLAGQPEYRLVHQLFLHETALALVLFDASRPDDPLRDVGEWEKALRTAVGHDPVKILVAARADTSGVTLSPEKIERFCEERGYAAYLPTSAKLGDGCSALQEAVAQHIPWDRLPWTATPTLFKALKDAIVRLKDEDLALLRFSELRQRLQTACPDETFTEPELRTVVRLLEGQGLVRALSYGDFVLLQPEQLNNYASAVVRAARAHVDGIGCIAERVVLDAAFEFQGMERIEKADEQVLLPALVQTFLDHSLCIREETPQGVQLVFPSQYNREREKQEHPAVLVTYRFSGPLANLYASLVVRLHYSGVFESQELWKNAADFRTLEGKTVGLVMKRVDEGVGEIKVFFDPAIPDDTRVLFIKFIHDHLKRYATDVEREREYFCPNPKCKKPVTERAAIKQRLQEGKTFVFCVYCDKKIPLLDLIEQKYKEDRFERRVRELDAQAQINLDNESRELILVGEATALAAHAGQIYRGYTNSDWGIDGEIEFKDGKNRASGKRVYLQLKSGDSHLHKRRDGREFFTIKNARHAEYWQQQAYPVYLVVRTSDGTIRWMNVTEYLAHHAEELQEQANKKTTQKEKSIQIEFIAEPFDLPSLLKVRERYLG